MRFRQAAPQSTVMPRVRELNNAVAPTMKRATDATGLDLGAFAVVVIDAGHPRGVEIARRFESAGCGVPFRDPCGASILAGTREAVASALEGELARLARGPGSPGGVPIVFYVDGSVVGIEIGPQPFAGDA